MPPNNVIIQLLMIRIIIITIIITIVITSIIYNTDNNAKYYALPTEALFFIAEPRRLLARRCGAQS